MLCGAVCSLFTHLTSYVPYSVLPSLEVQDHLTDYRRNLIKHRHNLTESAAASRASMLLSGSIFFYFIVRRPPPPLMFPFLLTPTYNTS